MCSTLAPVKNRPLQLPVLFVSFIVNHKSSRMLSTLKKWAIPFLAVTFFACQKDVQQKTPALSLQNNLQGIAVEPVPCGTPVTAGLIEQGGVLTLGSVTISNDAVNYYIKVEAAAGRVVRRISYAAGTQTHVEEAFTLPDFYYTACNGPKSPDQVLTFAVGSAPTSTTITIPISFGDELGCIWLGLVATTSDADGANSLCGYADAGSNTIFGSADYQSGFQYCKQDCPPPPDCGQLKTYTPGGWGAPPQGFNPGKYLHDNFATVFPNGLTVGCSPNFNVLFTSAQAITDALPAGGTPAKLTKNYVNPTTANLKNTLYMHVVSLALSVGFDAADPDFAPGSNNLGDMVIGSGVYAGKTVSQFLKIASDVLGGCNTTDKIGDVTAVATAINENYDNGTTNNGYLVCPTN